MNLLPIVMRLREVEAEEHAKKVRRIGITNNVLYNTAYYGKPVSDPAGDLYAWCVVFQWWCFRKVGIDSSIFPRSASVFDVRDWYDAKGRFHSSNPQVGDLVIYAKSHIGFVQKLLDGGRIQTIEGNISSRVVRLTTKANDPGIQGYCRPAYELVKDPDRSPGGITELILQSLPRLVQGDEGADVRRLHGLLRAAGQELPGVQNSDGTFKGEFTTTTRNALRAVTGRTTVTAAQWKQLLGV